LRGDQERDLLELLNDGLDLLRISPIFGLFMTLVAVADSVYPFWQRMLHPPSHVVG
jgi:hypothetical protein